MNSQRWFWLIFPLVLATLACSLQANQDKEQSPTGLPTTQLIGQPNSVALVTVTPTQTIRPTNTAPAAPIQATQSCALQTSWVTMTVAQGDTLFSIAQRTGSTVSALSQANCLSDANSLRVGQTLYVPVAPAPISSAIPTLGGGVIATVTTAPPLNTTCTNQWFFRFSGTFGETRCPNAVITTNAAGQDFEGGRVFWYAAGGNYSVPQIYVAFNDRKGWSVYGDDWKQGMPYDDPTLVPPAGRYQPVAGIGLLWRTQPGLRDKLGWAYEPEAAFTGRRQEPIFPAGVTPTQTVLYLDYGKSSLVLRLTQNLTGDKAQQWETVGGY